MPGSAPRMTMTTQAVLRMFVDDPTTIRYGLEICAVTGLPSGTIHPILARLENLGWVESDWEKIDPKSEGRPRRRYYRISERGLAMGRQSLAEVHAAKAKLTGRLRPIGETS
jgi:PadR family transcriptional regulator, regulatory protein PadR